jgi:hypothetical protein
MTGNQIEDKFIQELSENVQIRNRALAKRKQKRLTQDQREAIEDKLCKISYQMDKLREKEDELRAKLEEANKQYG